MKLFSAFDDLRALFKLARGSSTSAVSPGADVFYLNPANNNEKPFRLRRQMFVSTSIVGIVVLLVLSAFLTIVALVASQVVQTERTLDQSGIPTRATVTNCEKLKNGRPSVTYSYVVTDANGAKTTYTDEALGDYYQFCVVKGGTISIKYLADSPTTTKITEPGLVSDGASIANLIWVSPLAVILLLIMLGYTWQHLRLSWRYRQFKAKGKILKGQIVTAQWRNGRGSSSLKLAYLFRTPQGRTIKAEQSQLRPDLAAEDLPPTGTPVRILYASDRIYRLL